MKNIDTPLMTLTDPYADDPPWVAAHLTVSDRAEGVLIRARLSVQTVALLVQQGAALLGSQIRKV